MSLPLPQLRLDLDALDHNIRTMASWCTEHDVALAPHVKTTMSEPVVARQVAVKVRTELSVTRAEHDAMARVLDGCADEPLLTSDDVRWPAPVR